MINGVNTNQRVAQTYGNQKSSNSDKAKKPLTNDEAAAVLELGKSNESNAGTYSISAASNSGKAAGADSGLSEGETAAVEDDSENIDTKGLNATEINRLWEEANRATQHLRGLVEELLKSQGKTSNDVLSGKEELVVDEKTRAAAADAISENGECGVQAVSDRIVAFAKAISNDNPEMYDKLMGAIDEGFASAEKALGGQLPDICKKTREEVDRKMGEWKNSKDSAEGVD